ncbi:MAG: hypothetical protein ABJH28_20710 [Paraglaciecola sp.]|uniref:hypothetical protein n=1 Tax=Paraglaciecola sp. TaxID=1920173 RepID=UPI00326332F5
MNIYYLLITIFLLVTAISTSHAKSKFENDQLSLAKSNAGNDLASSSSSMTSRFEITAGETKKTADIVFKPFSKMSNFSLTLSAPLNDTSDPNDLYDSETDSFANSTTLKINYRKYNAPNISLKPSQRFNVIEQCLAKPEAFKFEASKETEEAIKEEKEKYCVTNPDSLVAKYKEGILPDAENREVQKVIDEYIKTPFTFWGATMSYGRQEYKYFNTDEIDILEETENPWGGSVYYSYVIPESVWITIELAYQRGFKAQKSETRCPTTDLTSASFISCAESSLGAPENDTNRNISVAFRKKFKGLDLAIAPKLTYDFEDDEQSFSLPVYFLGNTEGNLTAGVRFDHDTGDEGSKFSLFVGSKFEINGSD